MKYNLLNTILFLTVVLVSCNSVDDVLKPSDSISISILETLDTVRVVPGDTVSFKFMVFTNGGAIKNIDLETNDEIFEKHPEKMTFGLIDSIELTVDENGNLSRDVSSLIVEYPVYIKKNPAVVNNTLKAVFRATNKQGKSASNYVHFKGLNSRIKKTNSLSCQLILFPSKTASLTLSTIKHTAKRNLSAPKSPSKGVTR